MQVCRRCVQMNSRWRLPQKMPVLLVAVSYGVSAVLRFTRSECNTGHIVAKLQAAISCTHLKKSCQVVA